MTNNRRFSSLFWTTATQSSRPRSTVAFEAAVCGISCCSRSGGVSGL
jgi:hypothetical protein